jgi:exonuclease III
LKKIITFLFVCTFILNAVGQQTETVSVMTYNLLAYRVATNACPFSQNNPQTKETHLKTITKHVMPDILVCNEIGGGSATNGDFILSNVLNTDGVNYYQKASYSNNTFSNLVNMLYYNSNVFTLKSQGVITKDLSNNNLVRVIDIYRLYYNDPLLTVQSDTVFLYVIAAHLKAGNTAADLTQRTDATAAVMQYVQTKLSNQNVIFCGDLNIYKSQEAAYQNLTQYSHTPSRFYDPLNQPGNWSSNSAFALIHTQSTRLGQTNGGCFSGGGLDDRLDHILISNEVRDNTDGIRYIPNTYFTLGNDGNHFNQDIKNGSNNSVPANVLNALYELSDHLPVIAEFELYKNTIGVEDLTVSDIQFNNPVTDQLRVLVNNRGAISPSYRLLDLTGKCLASGKFMRYADGWQAELSVANLPRGIYLFEAQTINGTAVVQKIIKQ